MQCNIIGWDGPFLNTFCTHTYMHTHITSLIRKLTNIGAIEAPFPGCIREPN